MIPGAKCCTWRKKCSTWCRYRSWYKVLPPQSWSSFPPNHTMVVVQSPFLQNCFKRIHDKPKSERYFILQNKLHMMRLRLWELHGMKLVLFKIGFGLATQKLSSTGEKNYIFTFSWDDVSATLRCLSHCHHRAPRALTFTRADRGSARWPNSPARSPSQLGCIAPTGKIPTNQPQSVESQDGCWQSEHRE